MPVLANLGTPREGFAKNVFLLRSNISYFDHCRLIGKTITKYFNSEIKEAAGPLQTCAGHGAGAEAAIHGM